MTHKLAKYNTWLILLSLALAILLGILTPHFFEPIQFIGDIFINLLKLFALPLICSALIAILGNMAGGLTQLKAFSKASISYMLLSEVMAVTIALVLFNTFHPGTGGNASLIAGAEELTAPTQELSFSAFFLAIIPNNIFAALAHFDLLPVVVFSIIFGLGCAFVGDPARPLVNLMSSIREVSARCLHGIMLLAPIGIFVLVGAGVAQSRLSGTLEENLTALLGFMAVLFFGLLVHAFWQVAMAAWLSKQSIAHILRQSIPVLSTAFGTSSSVATLPVAMETADELKANPTVTKFMLPLCAAINVGGMMMYEMAAVLFFSEMLGFDLSLYQQILLAAACILGGMAEGGIPETSLVSLVVVFRIANIPLSAISILLPLDRIIDRVRTMVNIFGNMCGVITVSHWAEERVSFRAE